MSMRQSFGRPHTRTFTATTTATTFYPPVRTNFVQIRNEGSVSVEMWFDSDDSSDATRAVVLAASGAAGDYFEGPAHLLPGADHRDASRGGITLEAASSTASVRCVFYQQE